MNNYKKVRLKEWECFGCKRSMKKDRYIRKTIARTSVLKCMACGFHNSPEIFYKLEKVKDQWLVFGIPLKEQLASNKNKKRLWLIK